jgi:arylformamidase
MTRVQLDAAYNNSAAVANSADKIAEWSERSARLRARQGQLLDLRYGDRPRNRIDVFTCGRAGAPLFVFVHGGYWQRNDKEIFSCMAEGPMADGFDVALPGYTLAPDASLTDIVAEVRAAIRCARAVMASPAKNSSSAAGRPAVISPRWRWTCLMSMLGLRSAESSMSSPAG